jgi:ABC-type nitrate/sulfonate/bicarbonate transport system substrate-binding protein
MDKISLILLGTIVAAVILGPNSIYAQQLVRVGYSGTGVAKNLHKTIERAGLWKKRGLDIRLIYFTSGATMAQAMVGGDLDIADSDVPAMLNAVSSGVLDGKLISVYVNRFLLPLSCATKSNPPKTSKANASPSVASAPLPKSRQECCCAILN